MNVLSLFSGIGGLELGLERAGMTVVGQVELDEYCRRVLAKHWPEVPRHDDVRTAVDWWCGNVPDSNHEGRDRSTELQARRLAVRPTGEVRADVDGRGIGDGTYAERPTVDVICGGFPCQDISSAGKRVGIGGTRSGLWVYMADAVRVLRPRYVVMENVSAILVRGLDVVAADLAEIGYDLQWDCIPAASVGAPHRRDRWWGVAYANDSQVRGGESAPRSQGSTSGRGEAVSASRRGGGDAGARDVADTERPGLQRFPWSSKRLSLVAEGSQSSGGQWFAEPDVGRVAHGIPKRVDRLRALGNSVVPQVSEHVGRLLMDFDQERAA